MVAPPAAAISPLDHRGWVVIATVLGVVMGLLALGVRLFIRTAKSPPIGMDDMALCIATALSIVQSSLILLQVHEGFGKTIDHIPSAQLETVQKIAYAATSLYLVTLYAAKGSMLYLLIRITPYEKLQRLFRIGLCACAALLAIFLALVLLSCTLSRPWIQYGEKCNGLLERWGAITAFDIITEVLLFTAPLGFLAQRQMPRKQKAKVVFAFGTRLPIIAFAVLRFRAMDREIKSSDRTLDGALVAVWTQSGMQYALIATTLPCLTSFLSMMDTNFGAVELGTIHALNGSSNGNSVGKTSNSSRIMVSNRMDDGNDNRVEIESKVFCGRPSIESSEHTGHDT